MFYKAELRKLGANLYTVCVHQRHNADTWGVYKDNGIAFVGVLVEKSSDDGWVLVQQPEEGKSYFVVPPEDVDNPLRYGAPLSNLEKIKVDAT